MLIHWKLTNAAQLITSNKNAFIAFIFPSFQVKTANYSSAPMQGRKKHFYFEKRNLSVLMKITIFTIFDSQKIVLHVAMEEGIRYCQLF